ncbi:dUTP diphosphatase [uncultured Clostridium sp.]|uniref:dUTP diphosphatase n=1 Tax=uncultured Clostridium sp. TaxID=59620 RepID=UPI0025DFCB4E|nr:dUTP diphosphatase [uncultured Clostridium sp.]
MNIANLFEIQNKISSNLKVDPTLSEYKILARKHVKLHISLSDLANETKCYTYLVNDNTTLDNNKIFEKYITCFKEIIALGLYNSYNDIEELDIELSEYCLSDQFLNLYIDINDLVISPSKDHFITLAEDYLSLGISLGFTEKMILDSFSKESF